MITTLTIIFLSIAIFIMAVNIKLAHLSRDESKQLYQQLRDKENEKPLLLKKGDRGVANFVTHRGFYTNDTVSEDMITVSAEFELVAVFDDLCTVNVLNVHDHVSGISARKHINRVGSQVNINHVKWETKYEALQLSDKDIIKLYKNKKLKAGNVDIEYTGDSSPIELIDKLIV